MMNPLHAGDAYVSRDTTTARKTAEECCVNVGWCQRKARGNRLLTVKNGYITEDRNHRKYLACEVLVPLTHEK